MHPSALQNAKKFVNKYLKQDAGKKLKILEIGSQVVNDSWGRMKQPFTKTSGLWEYTGIDMQAGDSVDIVLDDPYVYPFEDNHFDAVVSSSCLEHNEMFWLTFKEIVRVTKSGGLIYLCVPSTGRVHRYPVDCWRFYPDAYHALSKWCPEAKVVENYISPGGMWKDNIGIFRVKK